MTPMERLEWQRKNRRVLYGCIAGFVVAVCVLRIFAGVPL